MHVGGDSTVATLKTKLRAAEAKAHASVALPEGSAFLEHLRKTIKRFEGFESTWRSHEMADPALQKFKGVLHLKFLTHR